MTRTAENSKKQHPILLFRIAGEFLH